MAWARLDDTFHDHPKVAHLRAAGPDGLAALGLWTLGLTWSKRKQSHGKVPASVVVLLAGSKPRARRLTELLEDAGLWHVQEGAIEYHDAGHYEPTKELSAKRAAAGKKGAAVRHGSVAKSQTDARTKPGGSQALANGVPEPPVASAASRVDARVDPEPERTFGTPEPESHNDDDVRTSTTPATGPPDPSSSSTLEERLTPLRDALHHALGGPVSWATSPRFSANDLRVIADLADQLGAPALVDRAVRQSAGRGPAEHVAAYLANWRALAREHGKPRPADTRCATHDVQLVAGVCPSCRADALAADEPPDDIPAGTPPPAEAIAAAKAALNGAPDPEPAPASGLPPAAQPEPDVEPEPVTVPAWTSSEEEPF
jgi:hypothetical protein